MATYAVTFGINGTLSAMPADPKGAFAWTNPITGGSAEKIDNLRHAAYNGRGEYISVNHPGDSLADTITLSQAMDGIFEELGSAEGAASSVAFNSQTIEADSVVFRAFFNTIDDTGSLVAQKINPDGTLNEDASGDPIFEWDAADRLDLATSSSSDSRAIITYDDNGASSAGVAFQWSSGGSPITAGQQALLETPPPNLVANAPIGDDRLDYLRGHFVNEGYSAASDEFRIRPSTEGKMGDVVHSTPVYVGEPEFTGRNTGQYPGVIYAVTNDLYSKFRADNSSRNAIVYVGANDGMMHGFDSDTGDEIFGYVPNVVIENLPDLTDPNYSHRYYVDLTPSINDIFMVKDGAISATWNTVLVGGLGAGGKGYYALNITDPTQLTSESNADDIVMWEFTEADDGIVGNSDLGYSYSQPLIAMSNAEDAGGENKWVAIFGNGYNSTSADGDAAIYMVFIEDGQDGVWTAGSDYIKISTCNGIAESSDGTTPNGIGGVRGIDIDGNGTVDRFYAGDLQGNLYLIDVSSTTAGVWDNAANQDIIFQAKYKANDAFARDIVQPITTRPIVINHPDQPGYIVIFATGSWFTVGDATSTDIQSVYGI